MDEQVRTEIVRILTVVNSISNQIYYARADASASSPYVVFSSLTSEKTKDTKDHYVTYYIQMDVFSTSENPVEAEKLSRRISDALDESEGQFNVTNWDVISVDEIRPARTVPDENFFQVTSDFRIKLMKKQTKIDAVESIAFNESIQT